MAGSNIVVHINGPFLENGNVCEFVAAISEKGRRDWRRRPSRSPVLQPAFLTGIKFISPAESATSLSDLVSESDVPPRLVLLICFGVQRGRTEKHKVTESAIGNGGLL